MSEMTVATSSEMQAATDVAMSHAGMLMVRGIVSVGKTSVRAVCIGHDTCDMARRYVRGLARNCGIDDDLRDAFIACGVCTETSFTVHGYAPVECIARAFRDSPLMRDYVRGMEAAMERGAHVVIGMACMGDGIVWGACEAFGRFSIDEYAKRASRWKAPRVGADKRGRRKVLAPESRDATLSRSVMEPVLLYAGFRRGVHALDGEECWFHDDPVLNNSTFVRASRLTLERLAAERVGGRIVTETQA